MRPARGTPTETLRPSPPTGGISPPALITLAGLAAPSVWSWRHLRSPAVSAWSEPALPGTRSGPLFLRHGGSGRDGVLLLHGILSTGDVFGADFDVLTVDRRLAVPDLLGFGRSLDPSRTSFTPDAHLDAIDESLDTIAATSGRWTVGAHSMGAALALRWALRHPERVERVVCWGAPIQRNPDAARAAISGSMMLRLFALDTRWARWACRANCRHRTLAGWLSAVAEPSLPVPLARAASLHTWPAFRDAVQDLIVDTDWQDLITEVSGRGIGVDLVWGSDDSTYDPVHARELAELRPLISLREIPDAGHRLPLTHPRTCLGHLGG